MNTNFADFFCVLGHVLSSLFSSIAKKRRILFFKQEKEARKGLLLVKIKGLSYEEYRSQNNMQHRITVLPFRLHSYSYQK